MLVQLDLKPEGSAQADRTLQPDPTAHQVDQLLGDSGPETGAAKAPRRTLIRLREALEDLRLRLGRNADSRVANRELEAHSLSSLVLCRDVHRHAALLGEFEGVSD